MVPLQYYNITILQYYFKLQQIFIQIHMVLVEGT